MFVDRLIRTLPLTSSPPKQKFPLWKFLKEFDERNGPARWEGSNHKNNVQLGPASKVEKSGFLGKG